MQARGFIVSYCLMTNHTNRTEPKCTL
jgi:hypothetical protein